MCWQDRKLQIKSYTHVYNLLRLLKWVGRRASLWEDGDCCWTGLPGSRKAQAVLLPLENLGLEARAESEPWVLRQDSVCGPGT